MRRIQRQRHTASKKRGANGRSNKGRGSVRPATAHRKRGSGERERPEFNAAEVWHEPLDDESNNEIRYVTHEPGEGYVHPVTASDVERRLRDFPKKFLKGVDVIQFSPMTNKRRLFPCYGMQWGSTVYLYPIEESLIELYVRPPRPAQLVEAKMYGGHWSQDGDLWQLRWTPQAICDFYLNSILIHEIGHINDPRNSSYTDRERFADWFAIEYGYRASRKRR